MLNIKSSTFLKAIGLLIVVIVATFGIYKAKYLSQAIPVYLQYLEQRNKWDSVNTGTYAYLALNMGSSYLFIKDNQLVKFHLFGNKDNLEFVRDINKTNSSMPRQIEFIIENKECLIDARFDDIKSILWEKLWDNTPFQFLHGSHMETIDIVYDKQYGYPVVVAWHDHDPRIKLVFPDAFDWISLHLKMLPRDTQYTDEKLQKILSEYLPHYPEPFPEGKMINKVGGDIIKSMIFEEE